MVDIEETLTRELREVANGVQVPAMPHVDPRAPRHWQPLLVAASVALVVAGAVGLVVLTQDRQEVQPAPPVPSLTTSTTSTTSTPTTASPVTTIPRSAPTVPYVLDQRLYVAGEQVPGAWYLVRGVDDGWLALGTDNTWWWGRGPKRTQLTGPHDVPPVISSNGAYVAEIRAEAGKPGKGVLTGYDTRTGDLLGEVPIDLGSRQDGSTLAIWAVTDDGRVVAQGSKVSLLWLPLAGNRTVDLAVTAPGQSILGSTPAGFIAVFSEGDLAHEGVDGDAYLAELSDGGELTRIGTVPAHDKLVVSPGAVWLAFAPAGTMGGEVFSIPTLEAQTVDGSRRLTLSAPAGWAFDTQSYLWEDDEHLVALVLRDGDGRQRMARCGPDAGRCVLIEAG